MSYVAPRGENPIQIQELSQAIMREADTNHSGVIEFQEFLSWNGKEVILSWIDTHYHGLLDAYGESTPSAGLDWESYAISLED